VRPTSQQLALINSAKSCLTSRLFAYLIRLSYFLVLGASGTNKNILTMTTVEYNIVSGMEYQHLTAINGRPNYENVNTIRRQIYANAMSVDSLREVPHGHLGQIMTPATYITVAATPYNNQPHPGPLPPRPAAVSPQQWEDTKAGHKRALDEYNTSNNFDKAIKQQMVRAIKDPIFLKPIENHITGFSRVTARVML
jgi:hypothetical protein